MNIILLSSEKDLAVTGQDVVRLFYPDCKIYLQPAADCAMTLTVSVAREGSRLTGIAQLAASDTCMMEEVSTDKIPVAGERRNHQKRLVKLALFRLLCRFTRTSPSPWGILTGIRPTKIVHRLLDLDWKQLEIIEYLAANYDMALDKAALLTEIACRARPFLNTADRAGKIVSVYVGIPFCPTRCAYCSFPSYCVGKSGYLIGPFLEALHHEIISLSKALADLDVKVQTIYIGGGTPTVLENDKLRLLMECIRDFLVSCHTVEITLEAGRPDTVTEDKLKTAREYGVTRLSINPQSMNPATLAKIGRKHTPADIVRSVELARRLGFTNINMDIIIGLPGENIGDIENTLREIKTINPENLTVHTLAVKRASNIKETKEEYILPSTGEVGRMYEITATAAAEMDMHPYYLYRQKRMVGPFENIGYTRDGFDCIYNIQVIEERQTVIGLGGGAGSKFIEPGTWSLASHYNPKDPANYIERIEELVAKKFSLSRKNFSSTGKI